MSWRLKWNGLWSRRWQQDLDDELQSHIDLKAEELIASGMPEKQAEEEARRRFGNVTRVREETSEHHVFSPLETVLQDIRYGCRVLRRQPLFTLAAVLTLGLVIGANGAIFSMVEAVLLRALPYAHPEQLVLLFGQDRKGESTGISMPDLEDWRQAPSLSAIAAFQSQSVNLIGVDEPTRLIGGFVSANFFSSVIQSKPVIGRDFSPADDQPGAARVCILNYGVWQDRFGGDASLVGRALNLNGESYTVIGIMPASFKPTMLMAEAWIPVQNYPNFSRDRKSQNVIAMGRMAPGVHLERVRSDLSLITKRLAAQYPDTNRDRGAIVQSYHEAMVRGIRPVLLLLAGAVLCVLLIGCANIAALLITKASARRREMAVRASLGATEGRLARQLLTESLILALLGGALGVLFCFGAVRLLAAYSSDLPRDIALEVNTPVLLFLFAVSLITGCLFGAAPAVLARRGAAQATRQRGVGASQGRMRNVLVSAQVALALVLLVGAGLMTKSVERITGVDPGFRTDRILTMEYRLPRNKYPKGPQQTQFHQEVVARVSALPGVESAGLIRALPFSGNGPTVNISIPDRPEPPPEAPFTVLYHAVTPTYFTTVGMPVLEGRGFEDRDSADSARVIIVSKSLAERYWPGKSAIGREVKVPKRDELAANGEKVTASIIGVVPDAKQDSLDDNTPPQLYVPYAQDPFIFATLAVHTKGDPMAMAKTVQRAIWSIDKDQPMWKIRTLQYLVERTISYRQHMAFLLTCFSVLALGLAAIGVYGVLAFAVTQRTSEFGIRMALGAKPESLLAMVLRNGLLLASSGLFIGIVASFGLSRYLRSQLYEVSATDPSVYATISLLLLAVAAIASLVPARRAMRVDPVIALRHE